VFALSIALVGCSQRRRGDNEFPDPPEHGILRVDNTPFAIPDLPALLQPGAPNQEGERVWVLRAGNGLSCGLLMAHEAAQAQAEQSFAEDGDFDAFLAAVEEADLALRPAGAWTLRLDLGVHETLSTSSLRPIDFVLFGARRGDDPDDPTADDVEVVAEGAEVTELDADEESVSFALKLEALWSRAGDEDTWQEFRLIGSADACPTD